jgi:hypothetical protein
MRRYQIRWGGRLGGRPIDVSGKVPPYDCGHKHRSLRVARKCLRWCAGQEVWAITDEGQIVPLTAEEREEFVKPKYPIEEEQKPVFRIIS